MPQYERKTGYVLRTISNFGFIAPEFDHDHPEQYFFHVKRVRGMAMPNIGAQVTFFAELPKATDPDKRLKAFDIEILAPRPLEAA